MCSTRTCCAPPLRRRRSASTCNVYALRVCRSAQSATTRAKITTGFPRHAQGAATADYIANSVLKGISGEENAASAATKIAGALPTNPSQAAPRPPTNTSAACSTANAPENSHYQPKRRRGRITPRPDPATTAATQTAPNRYPPHPPPQQRAQPNPLRPCVPAPKSPATLPFS